jgi:hypothetical protein
MPTVTQPPGYTNAGLTSAELTTISQTLNQPIDSLPPLQELTPEQLNAIKTADPQIHAKISSYSNPSLTKPKVQLDTVSMTILLAELNKELGEMAVDFAKEGLKIVKDKKASLNKELAKKIQEAAQKFAEATKKQKGGKIWGWIGAALGVVAAIAVCVLTAGAAAPLVACAVVGLVCALTSLTVQILEETGAMEKMMLATCKALGYNEEQTQKYMKNVRLAITITVAVVGLLAAVGSIVGSAVVAYKAAKVATEATKITQQLSTTQKVAATISTGAELGESVAAVGSGINTIQTSNAQADGLKAQADAKELKAWINKLQSILDQETEELQQILEKLQKLAFTEPKKVLESIMETYNVIVSERGESATA